MSESKKNTTKAASITDREEQLLKIFRTYYGHDQQAKMTYVMTYFDWSFEKIEKIALLLKKTKTFTEIDACVDLVEILEAIPSKRDDKETLMTLACAYNGNIRSLRIFNEIRSSIGSGELSIDDIVEVLNSFNHLNDVVGEECIIKALRIIGKIKHRHSHTCDIKRAILMCHSPYTMRQVMELSQRGCAPEVIESILVRYRSDGSAQRRALEKEILRRRLIGSIRDDYSYL